MPELYLPAPETDLSLWPTVACDQYTSEPAYWQRVEEKVGDSPSTLRLMLPELYLNEADVDMRIEAIHNTMNAYLANGTLRSIGEGLMLTERCCGGKKRLGLMLALDLDRYDYHKGSKTLIRATEGTIEERIPPRLKVRRNAPIEMPHILVLIDDPEKTVIEPLAAENLPVQYDIELMENGGHLTGRFLKDSARIEALFDALEALAAKAPDAGTEGAEPFLFALGDGNHSFATAKAYWEEIKQGLTEEERENHPARFALVELENIHDDGIVFEPIHRALFNVDPVECGMWLTKKYGYFPLESASEIAGLQKALDDYLSTHKEARLDYIHGEAVVRGLGEDARTMAFVLPAMKKEELFPLVAKEGALPRKMFSMGAASEKRFYMECRKIAENA